MTTEILKAKSSTLSATLRKVFSLMGRREKIAILILSLVILGDIFYFAHAFYVAQTNIVPTNGGRYREGILGQPRLINPLVGTTPADTSLIRLIYSGLYTYDDTGNIVPDLAENLPQISEDKKQYTITMRKNALWHNGKSVNADDVVFTIQLLQNQDYNSPLRSLWLNTTVSKAGDHTVVFSNKDIAAPFIHNLTLPIMPASVWSAVQPNAFLLSNINLEAVGSGPYTIREINKLPSGKIQSIRLESFSNYYGGKPYIDTVHTMFYENYEELVSALQSKSIDGFGYVSLDTTLSLNKNRNGVSFYQIPLPQYQGAFFNLKNGILADKAVRQALSLATDTIAIRQEIFGDTGLPISGPVLPEQVHEKSTYTPPIQDIATAVSLLETAGWKIAADSGIRTKNKTALSFTITTNDFPLNAKTAEQLANQWKKLNIEVKLNIVNTKDLTGTVLETRGYDVLVFAVKLNADPDPFVFWHSSQSKDPGLNITQFSNAEADKLISDGRNTLEFGARIEKYNRFQEIIASEIPAIFLNQTVYVYAVQNNVQGIQTQVLYDPSFRFDSVAKWYIEQTRTWKR